MMNRLTPFLLTLSLLSGCSSSPESVSRSELESSPADIVVVVNTAKPIREIPDDFAGLSYETRVLLPDADGNHYFDGNSHALIAAFRQLDIKSLRIGGNTAERASVEIPDEADIDALFAFAKAAGVRVIYTLRMEGNDPAEAARLARYIDDHYADLLDCLIIGNEPDKENTYEEYYARWKTFTSTINAPGNVPSATYCAPTTTGGSPEWAARMAADEAGGGRIEVIGQHCYPGGGSPEFADNPEVAHAAMMSLAWHDRYQKFHDRFAPEVLEHGLPYRLNETNSFHTGGVYGASDTFAATIWGLDYLYWWARHGAAGINFHTGQKVYPGDEVVRKNVYTGLTMTPEGARVLPLGYGIKAFTLAAHGNSLLHTDVRGAEEASFAAYATQSPEGDTVFITLLNGSFGENATTHRVRIEGVDTLEAAEWIGVEALDGNAYAVDGISLGGASIASDGSWDGDWSKLPHVSSGDDSVRIEVPPATVVLVRLSQ